MERIEKMAKDLQETHDYDGCEAWHCGGCEYEKYGKNYFCSSIKQAEKMTAKGYHMQEWISVDDRLPKVDTDVLVITANGSFKVARCNIYHNGTLVLWMTNDGLGEKAITHWMPLPEPPKAKGGE